jgi:hypothetical protein
MAAGRKAIRRAPVSLNELTSKKDVAGTKELTEANVDFHNPEEMARFREQQDALFQSRKEAIVVDLRRDGYFDAEGNWHFKQPLPDDMHPDSPSDFNH